MSRLILPTYFNSQPQYPAQVDYSYVKLGYVHALFNGLSLIDPTSGAFTNNGSAPITTYAGNSAATFNGTSQYLTKTINWSASGATLFGLIRLDASGSNRVAFCLSNSTGQDRHQVGYNGAGAYLAATSINSSGTAANAISATISLNQWYTVIATFSGTSDRRIFVDGVKTSDTTAITVGTQTTAAIGVRYTPSVGLAAYWSGGIALSGIINQALSDEEAIKLSKNIWQIFSQQPRKIWVDVPSGGATVAGPLIGAGRLSGSGILIGGRLIA